MEIPFDSYPDRGRKPFGRVKGSNCRQGYGLEFMRRTGQRKCAYCETDLTETFESWLTIVLDHVVPLSFCISAGVSVELCEDMSNRVLACSTCNGLCNRYKPTEELILPLTREAFYDLRDSVFVKRFELIAKRREDEKQFYKQKCWEYIPGNS
jgi:putative hemolysin